MTIVFDQKDFQMTSFPIIETDSDFTGAFLNAAADSPEKPDSDPGPEVPSPPHPTPGTPKPGDPPVTPRPGDPPPHEPTPDSPGPMRPKTQETQFAARLTCLL